MRFRDDFRIHSDLRFSKRWLPEIFTELNRRQPENSSILHTAKLSTMGSSKLSNEKDLALERPQVPHRKHQQTPEKESADHKETIRTDKLPDKSIVSGESDEQEPWNGHGALGTDIDDCPVRESLRLTYGDTIGFTRFPETTWNSCLTAEKNVLKKKPGSCCCERLWSS